jgi:hypothetical protein
MPAWSGRFIARAWPILRHDGAGAFARGRACAYANGIYSLGVALDMA